MAKKTLETAMPAAADIAAVYPRLAAAREAWSSGNEALPTHLRITSKKDGFRRAGMAHSGTVDHPVETFTDPDQVEALLCEPKLVVEFIRVDAPAEPDKVGE